ncbi:MAG: transposase [Chloroflexus sp.]|jgi:putative transposase|uniref:REP-associated tyrosine transposase n=3 Tax=Chloroflexus sp. TaxID=1904827 RepID=UPI0030A99CE7
MEQDTSMITWHHSPAHLFVPNAFYIVTASTLCHQPLFNSPQKLHILQSALFEIMQAYNWQLQAWAIFSNHYHFIAQSPEDSSSLKSLIQRFHSQTARAINVLDGSKGRKVWFQYWDTCLTYEQSYLARLNYVHNNPVKHGLVASAEQYPFCSATWFNERAPGALRRKLATIPYDNIDVPEVHCC